MKKNLKIVSVFLAVLFSTLAYAEDFLVISDAWIREGNLGGNTAVYMNITNLSDKDVVLEKISDPGRVASIIELHKTVTENGVSQMVHIDKLMIPAKQQISLAPKGLHIMLMGLKTQLKKDMPVKLVLHFADGKTMDLIVNVK